jgi:hypothetical protein
LVALLPLSFLVSQSNLVGWWLSSFDKVLNWRTSTLPSLRYKHQRLHRNDGLTSRWLLSFVPLLRGCLETISNRMHSTLLSLLSYLR